MHIDGSVQALDSLFNSLLDISRLDAGVIEAEPVAFAIEPLVRRICRDYEEEARAKGIKLVFRPCSLAVRSDPVLLERIVRNIISNAVRYTNVGRVVVGCRRRGVRMLIEVWDSGEGIAPAQQDEIFQEFFQVGNPGRDRGEGLGLGLAIVRRLTALLDHPLSVRSVLGRGSVFRLSLPRADTHEVVEHEAATPAPPHGGLILVIDDEVAIREAMEALLGSWGHDVIVAGSTAEMLERIADCTRPPDFVICDYRLGGETGVAAIERLQQEFNEDISAILVSGDTAPHCLIEARASGYVLLHKPLSEARLRNALGGLGGHRV